MKRISGILLMVALMAACKQEPRAAQARPEKLLRIAHTQEILTLDPQVLNDAVTRSIQGNIYQELVEFDSDMKITGCLAERWENPNDLTWRFYLRQGVRFHNGKPFSADDVVYTIRRGLSPLAEGAGPYLISVKEAKKISDYVVDIITSKPTPLLLNRLTFVPILSNNDHPDTPIDHPIGTGAYIFDRMVNQNLVVLHANPNYWGGKPDADKVEFVHYATDNELIDHQLKGEVQLTRDFSEALIPRIQDAPNCELITQDGLGVTLLGINLTDNPKDNPLLKLDVRRAIYHALNGQEIVTDTLGGKAMVATNLVSPNVFGFDPGFTAPERNLETAKQLLIQAGYPNGFHTDIYGTDEPRLKKLADMIGRAGIQIQMHYVPWKDLMDRMLNHQAPLFTLSWNCSPGDASDFLDSCVHTPVEQQGYGNFNLAQYKNPEVDKLIEQSGEILKPMDRKELLQKALGITMNDLPYIPLYARYRIYAVSKDISWHPRGDGRLYAFDVRWKQGEE